MKLITEMNDDVRLLIEANSEGKKNYFIEGVFMQAETKNRNGRIYPMNVLEHNFNGKAKIMDTPMGNIVKNLMDEGARLGVSTRGMGSLKQQNGINMVQPDFMLAAVDIVADPSAPDAFVDGIMEGREWIWENGLLKEQEISQYYNTIVNTPSRDIKKTFSNLFEDFLRKI